MQADSTLGPRQQVVAAFDTPIRCRTDGTRYGPRIPLQSWLDHRPRLEELHSLKRRREDMLKILERECEGFKCIFRPTLPQLNRKMQEWGYSKPCKTGETRHSPPRPVDTSPPGSSLSNTPADPDLLSNEDGTQLIQLKSNPSYPGPNMEELPSLDEDCYTEHDSMDDMLVSPILLSGDVASSSAYATDYLASPILNTHDILFSRQVAAYCTDVCCETLFRVHKKLIAASFLAGLRCWPEARAILSKVVADVDADSSISVSDKVWVNSTYNRLRGTSPHTAVVESELNVSNPLRRYVKQVESQQVSTALTTLCLTAQYRKFGSFEDLVLVNDDYDSRGGQAEVLSMELQTYEAQSKVLQHILCWCKLVLVDHDFKHTIEMLTQSVEHTDSLGDVVLPRLLAYQFMSSWMSEPPQPLLKILSSIKPRFGALFVPEVMLPELFIAVGHFLTHFALKSRRGLPTLSSPSFADEILRMLQKAAAKAAQMHLEECCSQIAHILIAVCSRTPDDSQLEFSSFSSLPVQVACKMMDIDDSNERSSKHPLTWMCTADIFKVSSIYHPSEALSTMNEPSIDPAMLSVTDRSINRDALLEHDPGSYIHIRNKSSSSTIEELLEASQQTLIDGLKECSMDVITPLKNVRSPMPRCHPTNSTSSTEREFKNVSARAEADRRRFGSIIIPARTSSKASSGSSRMSWTVSATPGRYSFYGGHEELDVGNSAHEASLAFDSLPTERYHAYDIDRNPQVSKWVKTQNAPTSILGRSTSAA